MPLTLRQFTCPYREEATCKFERNPTQCKFTHPVNDSSCRSVADLLNVPYFVCIHFWNGNCRGRVKEYQGSRMSTMGCVSGLHLQLTSFVGTGNDALEKFEQDNADLLRQFFGPDIDLVCTICLEKVLAKRYARNRRFGVLQNCSHTFCSACLISWHTNKKFCPVCRVESDQYEVKKRISTEPVPPPAPAPLPPVEMPSASDRQRIWMESLPGSSRDLNRIILGDNVRIERQLPPTPADGRMICQICLERVYQKVLVRRYRFAILENCDHIFCAYCVVALRCNPFSCPVCERESSRFAIKESFIRHNSVEKQRLFSRRFVTEATVFSFDERDPSSLELNGLPAYLDDHYFTYLDNLQMVERNFAGDGDDELEQEQQHLPPCRCYGNGHRRGCHNHYLNRRRMHCN